MSVFEKITNKLDKVNSAAASEREDICFPRYIQDDEEIEMPPPEVVRCKDGSIKAEIPSKFWSNYYIHDYSLVRDAVKLIYDAAVELKLAQYYISFILEQMPIYLGVHIAGVGYMEDKNGRYCFRDQFNTDGSRTRYSYEDKIVPIETEKLGDFIEELRINGNKEDPHIRKAIELLQEAYFDKLRNYVHYKAKHSSFKPRDDKNVYLHIDNVDGNIMLYGGYYGPEEQERVEKALPEKFYSNFSTEGLSDLTLKDIAKKGYFARSQSKYAICPEGNVMTRHNPARPGSVSFYYPDGCCESCQREDCIGKGKTESLYFGINTYLKDIAGKVLPNDTSSSDQDQ